MAASAVAKASRPRAPLWATLVATFFGIGRLRPGPGTWAIRSPRLLIWAAIAYGLSPSLRTPSAIALAVFDDTDRHPRRHPRRPRVGHEGSAVCGDRRGRWTTHRPHRRPLAWKTFLAGFILFRAFDIVKPPPVRQLEDFRRAPGSCSTMSRPELCVHRDASLAAFWSTKAVLSETRLASSIFVPVPVTSHGIFRPHPRQKERQRWTAHRNGGAVAGARRRRSPHQSVPDCARRNCSVRK